MSQLIVHIYKLSRTALKTKTRVVNVNHDPSHRFTGKSEKNFSLESTRLKRRYDILVLFVAQCTLVKRGVVHSEKSYFLLDTVYSF